LRVSGYYNRIYTLDNQIKWLDKKSLLEMGGWLRRKWIKTRERKEIQEKVLRGVWAAGVTEAHLQEQWKLQVVEQTKPLKKQLKEPANKEINDILALTKTLDLYKEEVAEYQGLLETETDTDTGQASEILVLLEEAQDYVRKTQRLILTKRSKLHVDGRLNLEKLLEDPFLQGRMNALAVKQRIRDRLRQRKFELKILERAY